LKKVTGRDSPVKAAWKKGERAVGMEDERMMEFSH
jgi:hypothetical protein